VNTPATAHAHTPPSGPSTIPQHALEGLQRAIVTGRLRPGQRVAQEEIAAQLGVSLAPVREALRTLEQEGQVTYLPRRGYFVTTLEIEDLEEIYELRAILETRAARRAAENLDGQALAEIIAAAHDCVAALAAGDAAGELEADRRFYFAILEAAEQPHTMRLIRLLWDSTEAYRALYYDLPVERRNEIESHDRLIEAVRARDADRLVAELDAQRGRALGVLCEILGRAR
jgi:DNA-binding GntR family transcriptional regulator